MQNTMQNTNATFTFTPVATAIAKLLNNASVTFASITYKTNIALSAANKHNNAYKVVTANVQLFNNINSATAVFTNAVQRNANKLHNEENNAANVNNFVQQSNYYTHSNACYSIVQHNKNNAQYLYCIYNNVSNTTYYLNNAVSNKQAIAALCTKSAAAKMLNSSNVTHNKTNNVTHSVVVRTIALANIISITANKQTINF